MYEKLPIFTSHKVWCICARIMLKLSAAPWLLSVCLLFYLSKIVFPFLTLSLSIDMPVYVSVCLSFSVSLSLSVCLSTWVSIFCYLKEIGYCQVTPFYLKLSSKPNWYEITLP